MNAPLTVDAVRALPKVLLHDHLDGGLRPATIIELAGEIGYDALPTADPAALGAWFRENADSGSLVRYLEGFTHTVAVMQTAAALRRVATECVLDLADDGIVHAETRFAPHQHLSAGLSLDDVVTAVLDGIAEGEARVKASGRTIRVGVLVDALRHLDHADEAADLVVRFRDRGVVGFDIAGPEDGFPPGDHASAFDHVRAHHCHVTVHAGEAAGVDSIAEAVWRCGAERLGHGVRLIEDVTVHGGMSTLGPVAAYVRDNRIALETCPSSNVHTGAVKSLAEHPVKQLDDLRLRVTVNTDNRLMSGTTLSEEFALLSATFGYGVADVRRLTLNAAKAVFAPFDERVRLIDDVLLPGFARAGA